MLPPKIYPTQTYFHFHKKLVSEIIQAEPWGAGGESRGEGAPAGSQHRQGERGLEGAPLLTPEQSDEQSLSRTKDIC